MLNEGPLRPVNSVPTGSSCTRLIRGRSFIGSDQINIQFTTKVFEHIQFFIRPGLHCVLHVWSYITFVQQSKFWNAQLRKLPSEQNLAFPLLELGS